MAEKRQPQDENDGHLINVSGPLRKRQQHIIQPVTDAAWEAAQKQWEEEAGAGPRLWHRSNATRRHKRKQKQPSMSSSKDSQRWSPSGSARQQAAFWPKDIAPTLCALLKMLARGCDEDTVNSAGRREVNLVVTTVICMLAQARNEKSSEYQTTMAFYLLACGATQSQFDVLSHAGICISYRTALRKINGQERLAKI
ncbi:hypothetical protein B0H14DRAFT_2619619 [Mycena olivaceomarginata]|nr:hypothetical protein B0H14DRAFT_2619619 [Mycena olivaceomarginata]